MFGLGVQVESALAVRGSCFSQEFSPPHVSSDLCAFHMTSSCWY